MKDHPESPSTSPGRGLGRGQSHWRDRAANVRSVPLRWSGMLRQWDCPAFVCCGHAGVSTEHLDTASHSAFRAVMTRTGAADWQDWPSLPLLLHFAPRGLQKRRIVLQNRSMSEPHGPSGPGLFIGLMLALSAERLDGIDASMTHGVATAALLLGTPGSGPKSR